MSTYNAVRTSAPAPDHSTERMEWEAACSLRAQPLARQGRAATRTVWATGRRTTTNLTSAIRQTFGRPTTHRIRIRIPWFWAAVGAGAVVVAQRRTVVAQ